ncbi:MAG: YkvA family protein [Rhodothermaceae bacterium]
MSDYNNFKNQYAGNYNSRQSVEEGSRYVEENLWQKVERTGKRVSFLNDVKALFSYIMDNNVSWYRKSIVVAALVYFISPVDTIPDLAPLFGYLDDLGVITATLKFLGSELIPYYDE